MDFVDGPIAGLDPEPDGEGAALIDMLMTHVTRPEFVYAHEWQPGDLVIGDNRCLLHAATWYDADTYARLMWRTTVMGNPGDAYRGEAASWVPVDGVALMEGMENA
ncbi:MAG: TauD/TfdA dioxygenase family protein, partial [Hyphomicrobiaceae bacterium]